MDTVGTFRDSSEEEMQDFGALLDDYLSFDEPQRGDIREAEIIKIEKSEIVVDMGVKRDGIVPPQDLERMPPELLQSIRVGDVVPVYVLNPSDADGNLIVSINLGLQGHDWDRARELLESGELVEAPVTGYNKGGLLVQFGRLEGFVPISHCVDIPHGLSGTERREAMEQMIGATIGLKVIEVNQSRRRLILSQREAQREWRASQKERLLSELRVGDIVPGRVTGIRDFGVFVDIGGADGLIHVSELAWHRVPHPADVVSIGDEVNVYVLELDHEQQRIALSLCRTLPDPWDTVLENYHVGQVVQGKVNNVVDFGAFVVLEDGIEGLLHITEMADGSLTEPYSYVRRGDTVVMHVVRIEPEKKRIGFTQKNLGITHPTAMPAPDVLLRGAADD
ncbi:MAG TPA: S1 RNA-binding domain-containing protein [Aggregatilineales bacterium]|nr:30S ribosomal protein S1 [Chloroflexota bacterium]HOA23900.1 S1 RNA-binding domain-containing protein [Aggregatilineales bacterium]HPV05965.1 S1 RNA-binding domain-containing protein [Aggregatilineales bacterium]HQA67466.1 S1 RNA-binding domain-containing protein [Aggregatilineales bacterium]HQE18674.1 S1 RNA-binding domain-containing protein [Aggregatilineales bacterium]